MAYMIEKPSFYDAFQCVAGACRFTCCQDWSIFVDEDTENKWKHMADPETMEKPLSCMQKHVCTGPGGRQIRLNPDGKCPFLNENKLCHIVLQYGEENISHTCHTYPREMHVYADREEMTLGMGCPAALQLLWEQESFSSVQEKKELESKEADPDEELVPADTQLLMLREYIEALLHREDIPVRMAIKMIFYILLDLYQKDEILDDYLQEVFREDTLAELQKAIKAVPTDAYETFVENNELFLDLAENYRKKEIYTSVLTELAERAEEYETDFGEEEVLERLHLYTEVEQNLEKKMRLLLQEEIFSTLVLPDEGIYEVVLKMQWIGIVFACLRHCLFLKWDLQDELTEENIMDITNVLIRMTGYTEEDIEEYLDRCFEDIIWDWGYMGLIS